MNAHVVFLVDVEKLLPERIVASPGHSKLLIQDRQDACRPALDQVQHVLVVRVACTR